MVAISPFSDVFYIIEEVLAGCPTELTNSDSESNIQLRNNHFS
jgi:hypothetical protein